MRYAILIDGGFVKRKLGHAKKPTEANDITSLVDRLQKHPDLVGNVLHRIYYYDSRPLLERVNKPLQGGEEDFGKSQVVGRMSILHKELARAPYFALRMGELSFNGWVVRGRTLNQKTSEIRITHEDLCPNITQKGVDMRLGMDIASLTLKKLVDIIVLVTGDSDFVPAMKFARREGAQLFLVTLGHGVKESMREHSDRLIELEPPPCGAASR